MVVVVVILWFSVDGDADAVVEARIRIGWNNSGSWYHCLQIRTCL